MAEIPIEKKSKGGVPWWVWLLIALVVAALLFWLFAGRDDDRSTQASAPTAISPAATVPTVAEGNAAGPITDLGTLLAQPDAQVVGRQVRLANVPAGDVPADAGFWITGDNGGREYVILHEVRTPNTPIEGRINVNKGDHLEIVGTVRAASEGVPKDSAIPGPTAPLPDGVSHYIDAQSVTKTR